MIPSHMHEFFLAVAYVHTSIFVEYCCNVGHKEFQLFETHIVVLKFLIPDFFWMVIKIIFDLQIKTPILIIIKGHYGE